MRTSYNHWRFLLATLTAIPGIALPNGYDIFSKHEELRGHVIIYSGDIEKISSPIGQLPMIEGLKVGGSRCYLTTSPVGGSSFGKRAALVLMDKDRDIKLAIIESGIGSIKIQTIPATLVACHNFN